MAITSTSTSAKTTSAKTTLNFVTSPSFGFMKPTNTSVWPTLGHRSSPSVISIIIINANFNLTQSSLSSSSNTSTFPHLKSTLKPTSDSKTLKIDCPQLHKQHQRQKMRRFRLQSAIVVPNQHSLIILDIAHHLSISYLSQRCHQPLIPISTLLTCSSSLYERRHTPMELLRFFVVLPKCQSSSSPQPSPSFLRLRSDK